MNFSDLKLEERLLEAISYMGFEAPTIIQEKVIPVILEHRDLIACAQTGTGKTGAFVLPVLNKLIGKTGTSTDTLIIVPTRELAIQIEQQIQGFSYFIPAESIAVYGGGSGIDYEIEKNALNKGTDIIIATPGRLLTHLKMGNVRFRHLTHLILDEADKMLDMGFIDDLQTIISYLPVKHQTLMFSATMPDSIRKLAQKILHNPVEISLAVSTPVMTLDQKAYLVSNEQKDELIINILHEKTEYDSIIIFTSSKSKITSIVKSLNKSGLSSHGISSNLDQEKREEVLRKFRSKKIRILVATDVMSRGIDIKDINLVINYDVPHDAEDYVHRVGRTARVNTKGEAITLVTQKELYKFKKIEKLIRMNIPKLDPPGGVGRSREARSGGDRVKSRGGEGEKMRRGDGEKRRGGDWKKTKRPGDRGTERKRN